MWSYGAQIVTKLSRLPCQLKYVVMKCKYLEHKLFGLHMQTIYCVHLKYMNVLCTNFDINWVLFWFCFIFFWQKESSLLKAIAKFDKAQRLSKHQTILLTGKG